MRATNKLNSTRDLRSVTVTRARTRRARNKDLIYDRIYESRSRENVEVNSIDRPVAVRVKIRAPFEKRRFFQQSPLPPPLPSARSARGRGSRDTEISTYAVIRKRGEESW